MLDPVYLEYITKNKNGVFIPFYPEMMSMEGRTDGQVARIKGNLRRGIDCSIFQNPDHAADK